MLGNEEMDEEGIDDPFVYIDYRHLQPQSPIHISSYNFHSIPVQVLRSTRRKTARCKPGDRKPYSPRTAPVR